MLNVEFLELPIVQEHANDLVLTLRSFLLMKIRTVFIAIISSIAFTSIIYNINIKEFILKYVAICIFYFFLFLFLSRREYSTVPLFFSCIISPILIDASVIFTYPLMVPLRFPFSSIFPILGCLWAVLLLKSKKIFFFITIILSFVFFWFSYTSFIPDIIFSSLTRENQSVSSSAILNGTFYDNNRNVVYLPDRMLAQCTIVELFFVGCLPCQWKEKSVDSISKQYSNTQLSVIFICDGTATSFDKFKAYTQDRANNKGIYLYDMDSVLFKSGISGYPTELLFKKHQLISITEGFDSIIATRYYKSKILKINQLLNETNP